MFGRKQRIIETQKALIADLREEIEHKEKMISVQTDRIFKLQEDIISRNNEIQRLRNKLNVNGICWTDSNIDFPNTQKGGVSNTGAVNVSDILNL